MRSARPGGVALGDFSEASGFAATVDLLARVPDLDAVFAASDLMALGAIRALRQAGRTVPADVAVVGFDDAAVAVQVDPPLTTVHQPVEAMGRTMAGTLHAMINGEPVTHAVLDTHLVHRSSG